MAETLSPQLNLARQWLNQLKCSVELMPEDPSVGRPFVALGVTRGASRFLVFETDTKVLVITAQIIPGQDAREVANSLSHDAQMKMLDVVKNTLLSDPRTGFDIIPKDVMRVGAIEAIRFEQLLRIDDGTVESFNRFEDAIQSVVSGTVKVMNLYMSAFRPAGIPKNKKGEHAAGQGYG